MRPFLLVLLLLLLLSAWFGVFWHVCTGITDVIFGRVSPSARFPVTVYDSQYLSKVGPVSDFSMTSMGVGRTYRYLDEQKSKPLWKFGATARQHLPCRHGDLPRQTKALSE
jgi:hypothetical protein